MGAPTPTWTTNVEGWEGSAHIVASVYGSHSSWAHTTDSNQLRNMFFHTNIILCDDWNMIEHKSNSSGDGCVVLKNHLSLKSSTI